MTESDFDLYQESRASNVVMVRPNTDAARQWTADNVQDPTWLGDRFAVESRYLAQLVDGMLADGFEVRAE